MTNAERNARIVEMVRQREKPLHEIGAVFGLSRAHVSLIGKAAGVARGNAGRIGAIPSDKKAHAVKLYRKGMPLAHISGTLGHSISGVVHFLVRQGHHMPTPKASIDAPWSGVEEDVVRSQYGDASASTIARKLGRTRNSVIGKAYRLGLRACEAPSSTAQPAHEMVAT